MDKTVDQNVIDKIRKLLDHHAGCLKINSEAEAMAAMDLAKNLMKKHHLDMMVFNEYSCSEDEITHKQMDKCSVYSFPLWMQNLVNIVNNICNCSCVLEKDKQSNGYVHINIVFVSQKTEIDRVYEMYMFFKKTIYKLSNEHVKTICGNYTHWRSFAEGFTSRLLERSRLYYGDRKESEKDNCDIEDLNENIEDDDFVESESEMENVDDEEQQNYEIDTVKMDKEKTVQLYKYLDDIKEKINSYIEKNINNVKQEKIKTKTRVLLSSYELGRKSAENQNLKFADKKHQLTHKKKD